MKRRVEIQIAAGTVSYFNKVTGGTIYTFYADIAVDGAVINAESCIDYESQEEAERAAKDFIERFPANYRVDRDQGLAVLNEFKMAIAPEDNQDEHPQVETKYKAELH